MNVIQIIGIILAISMGYFCGVWTVRLVYRLIKKKGVDETVSVYNKDNSLRDFGGLVNKRVNKDHSKEH